MLCSAGWEAHGRSTTLHSSVDPRQINAMEAQVQELLGTQATGGRGLHRQAGAGGLLLYTMAGGAYAAHPPERRFLLQATYLQLPLPPGYTLDQVRTPRLHSKTPDLPL
jgi:hypothetical protein